jgi:hypothetical protein
MTVIIGFLLAAYHEIGGKDIQLLYATSMGGVLAMSHPWKSVQGRHGVAVKNCGCVDKMWTVAAANRNSSWW